MGEKDKPNIFNGKQRLFFAEIGDKAFKELPIVDNSLLVACDTMKVREMAKVEPIDVERLIAGPYTFDVILKSRKDKVLYRWLIFGGRKPHGIKYPHKRRKIRILSKWINRYMHAYNYEK